MSGIDSAWDEPMHPDLEWLARNVPPKQFGQISVRRNHDFFLGYQWSDLRQKGKGWYHHAAIEQARKDLGLIMNDDEEEAMKILDQKLNSDNPSKLEYAPQDVAFSERRLSAEINDGIEDMINHPPHYQSESGIECIDAIRAALGKEGFIAFCRGNVIKYQWRLKSNPAEDQGKAAWYANKAREALEE